MSDLNDILEGEELDAPVEQAPQEAPQEAETPTDGPNRGPDGKFAPKAKDDGSMAEPDEDSKTVPFQSYKAEKQKRQEWETRYQNEVEALRRELEEMRKPKEPEAPPPSIWEDEQGWQQQFGSQVTQQAVQAAIQQNKLHTSELLMTQQHEDFSELKQDIFRFVGENPAVNAEVQNSPHPWQTAYKAYKNHETMKQLGTTDLSEMEAKLREQIKAELQQQQTPQATPPQSLADAQSARGSGQSAAANSLSLDDILKG